MVKRKHVSVKLAKLRAPFRDNSGSESGSSGVSLNISSIKRNNKLLARALNESRIKIRDLEESIMSLRTENVELRVQLSDLKAQFGSVNDACFSSKEYSEMDVQEHLVNYLEPLKSIFNTALDSTVSLSAEITRAMTYINAPQVIRRRSSINGRLFPLRKFSDKPRNKVKKVSPMVSGHIVHKPDIKIKKLDMSSLLGAAASEGIRITRDEEEPSGTNDDTILDETDMDIESQEHEEERETTPDEGGVSEEVSQIQNALSHAYQPRVSLRPFDLSLIEEADEEMPRRRKISRNRMSDKRRSELLTSTEIVEENGNQTLSVREEPPVFVAKEVTDALVSQESDDLPPTASVNNSPQSKKKESVQEISKKRIDDETPKSKTDVSDTMFLDAMNHDPQEGPSWLFEDLFDKNNKKRTSSRRTLRRKTSSCSKKLSFINYYPDPRELRPYDDGSSSDDLSFDEDETYQVKPKPKPLPQSNKAAKKSKGKRSNNATTATKSKRAKVEFEDAPEDVPKEADTPVEVIEINESETDEASSAVSTNNERPRRAAASSVCLKEPSLSSKLRNPNASKTKGGGRKSSKSKKKSE